MQEQPYRVFHGNQAGNVTFAPGASVAALAQRFASLTDAQSAVQRVQRISAFKAAQEGKR